MNIVEYAKMRKMFGGGSGGGEIEALTVSKNGTYTPPEGVDGYAPVTVNVVPPASDIDEFILRNVENVSSAADTVGSYAFADCQKLKYVDFPNAKIIRRYAFYMTNYDSTKPDYPIFVGNFPEVETIEPYAFSTNNGDKRCATLGVANFPKAKIIDEYAFYKNSGLYEVYFPEVTLIKQYAFGSNQSTNRVTKAAFPKLTTANSLALTQWRSIKILDLGLISTISNSLFGGDYCLIAVALRSETMCTLGNINAFNSCYHFYGTVNATYNPNGLKDGYIYVPRALIDSYKTATNWVTFADQFRALEDYTVDGTTTGELDESKVSL